jgi:hypothetical protein
MCTNISDLWQSAGFVYGSVPECWIVYTGFCRVFDCANVRKTLDTSETYPELKLGRKHIEKRGADFRLPPLGNGFLEGDLRRELNDSR